MSLPETFIFVVYIRYNFNLLSYFFIECSFYQVCRGKGHRERETSIYHWGENLNSLSVLYSKEISLAKIQYGYNCCRLQMKFPLPFGNCG